MGIFSKFQHLTDLPNITLIESKIAFTMRMTMKDTIAKQKSDIDKLQKEIKLKSLEAEDLRKKIADLNEELKKSKKMTQKEKIREWRLIDEEWNGIMEAKFNSQKSETDPKSRVKGTNHFDPTPKPLAALPIKEETNNIYGLHKTTTTTTIQTKSASNNEPSKEVELSPFKTMKISSEKKSTSSQDQGLTPTNVAPRANKRGRPRTKEKKVIHEKKIKLVKAFEELLLKDDKKSISIKDLEKDSTETRKPHWTFG